MKTYTVLFVASLALFLSACERKAIVCPEGSVTYLPDIQALPKLTSAGNAAPVEVEIRGKTMKFDRLSSAIDAACSSLPAGALYRAANSSVPPGE